MVTVNRPGHLDATKDAAMAVEQLLKGETDLPSWEISYDLRVVWQSRRVKLDFRVISRSL